MSNNKKYYYNITRKREKERGKKTGMNETPLFLTFSYFYRERLLHKKKRSFRNNYRHYPLPRSLKRPDRNKSERNVYLYAQRSASREFKLYVAPREEISD